MIVIPAVDIRGGRAVRLVRGRADAETVYADDPAEVAARFAAEGASWLHVVDLDAAFGTGENREAVRRAVAAVDVPVQVSGGLRTMEAAEAALAAGAARVVLGTRALADPGLVAEAARGLGERLAVAVDVDGDRVRARGWTEDAGAVDEVLPRLEAAGAPRFLVTAVSRDGTLAGPDLGLYERVRTLTVRPVIASGGVRDADDLRALAGLGVEAAVVGKALYEGTLTLAQALEAAR